MALVVIGVGRSLNNLQNICADADGGSLDVAPETDELGADLDFHSNTVSKVAILGQDHVTLTVIFKVLTLPSLDCVRSRGKDSSDDQSIS